MDEEKTRRPGVIGGLVGRVAPTVIRQIDLDAIVAELDVDAIAAQLDLDALMERIDVDAIAARLDLDALIARLDVDAIAAQLDLDALVERLDVEAVAARLDLDALMQRIDLNALAGELDMARITAGATGDVAVSGLDLVRRQLVRADATVEDTVDRLLRRDADSRPDAPRALREGAPQGGPVTVGAEDDPEERPRRRQVSGHYAGPVTRLLALAGDSAAALTVYGVVSSTVASLLQPLVGTDLDPGGRGWVSVFFVAAWLLVWFWLPVAFFGRTAAMALVGLGVVDRTGGVVGSTRALVRALVLPVSLAVLALGMIGMFVGRERRTLHDVAAGTVVVYDWGSRTAEQPAGIRDLLSARVRVRAAERESSS